MKNKNFYIAPSVKVVTFKVENGFVDSPLINNRIDLIGIENDDYNSHGQENWTQDNDNDNDNIFGTTW